jgi:hypothetical protein
MKAGYDSATRAAIFTLPSGQQLKVANVSRAQAAKLLARWASKYGKRAALAQDTLSDSYTFHR